MNFRDEVLGVDFGVEVKTEQKRNLYFKQLGGQFESILAKLVSKQHDQRGPGKYPPGPFVFHADAYYASTVATCADRHRTPLART
jgi:hypothetical protein